MQCWNSHPELRNAKQVLYQPNYTFSTLAFVCLCHHALPETTPHEGEAFNCQALSSGLRREKGVRDRVMARLPSSRQALVGRGRDNGGAAVESSPGTQQTHLVL